MRTFIFVTAYIIIAINAAGQNKRAPDGLRVGTWIEKYPTGYGRVGSGASASGTFKVIPLSTYDTVRSYGRNCYEVKYKKSTPVIFHWGLKNGNITVKDGIWNVYDSLDRLVEAENWIEGLNTGTKFYGQNGELKQYHYRDYENDTSFYITYFDNQVFKKSFFPPENKNNTVNIYYPANDLIISNAEPKFQVNFLYDPSDTQTIILSSKKELTIYSISSANNSVGISGSFTPTCYPLKITPESPAVLRLIANPKSHTYNEADTIFIKTSEDKPVYKICINTEAAHIDLKNVRTLKELRMSRTKDRYLIVRSLGTVTEVSIENKTRRTKYYEIHGITKIDLIDFPSLLYDMEVSSCHTGGRIKLTITD